MQFYVPNEQQRTQLFIIKTILFYINSYTFQHVRFIIKQECVKGR